jgi:glycosyltransferase involved in cell wall biosynthesis
MGPVGTATQSSPQTLPAADSRTDGLQVYRAVESWDWSAQGWFAGALQQIKPHIVSLQYHGEDFMLHPAVCLFAEIASQHGIPVVTTFHNLQKPRGWTHGREPLEWLLQTSQRWITTNELDRQEMSELPEAAEKLRLVPTGPNIAAPAAPAVPAASPKNSAGKQLRLTYFGFLNPVKGLEHLLEALALLRDQGTSVHLTLAADIHTDATSRLRDYAQFIDSEITRLQLTELVQRHGFLEERDLSQLLLRTDLAVFPFRDGLSGKNCSFWTTLEHATPALTTQGVGLPDGLEDMRNVLLAPIDDSAALAGRIRWALENRPALPAIGTAGQSYVRQQLDWSSLARDIQAIFAECSPGFNDDQEPQRLTRSPSK